ncbi:uncharacterized protein FFNC_15593 [Fusarium fujikuroi]|nr:uncharacterized protein FFC1_05950 [Fusarium fujikuroi]SCO54610.1 uncharacterized protein FFNC_15593 [Fusarium fujikuroi]
MSAFFLHPSQKSTRPSPLQTTNTTPAVRNSLQLYNQAYCTTGHNLNAFILL